MRFYNWLTDNIKLIGIKILAGITLTLGLHIFFVTDVYAQALDFDGVNDNASTSGGLPNNSNFTLEAWVNPRSFSYYNWAIQVGDVDLGASSSGYLTYSVDYSTLNSQSTQLIPLNTWSHIALVYDNVSYTLYYNGVALANTPQFNYPGKAPDHLTGFSISRNGGSEGWIGGIDEVRIWRVARTSAQIAANYNAELANPTQQSGLAAYYKMNEGAPGVTNTSITQLTDASGNNYYASLFNFALSGSTSNYIQQAFPLEFGYNDFPLTYNGIDVTMTTNGDSYAGAYQGQCNVNGGTKANSIGLNGANKYVTFRFTKNVNNVVIKIGAIDGGSVYKSVYTTNAGTTSISKIAGDSPCDAIISNNNELTYSFSSGHVDDRILITSTVSFNELTVTQPADNSDFALYTLYLGDIVITSPSCTNPTDGGTIGTAQTIAPGSTPSGLTQTVAPAGTPVGTLQYQWQSSVTSSSTGFSDITGATTTSYSPGALSQNTWYKRLVKVDCESNWVASNVVELTVVNSVTWTGATSTDWNTASNWNPAVVPTATVDATIPASGVTNYPEVASGTNAQVKNITHNGIVTKRITVASGGKLTVNGSYTAAANAEIKL